MDQKYVDATEPRRRALTKWGIPAIALFAGGSELTAALGLPEILPVGRFIAVSFEVGFLVSPSIPVDKEK